MKNRNKARKPAPITGIIMPSRWNEQGKPARIAIHTDDQKEYEIGFNGAGKELMNLTYKKVALHGKIREQLNGRAILSVSRYQIQDDAPGSGAPNNQAA
jgi:hypothetical protein